MAFATMSIELPRFEPKATKAISGIFI
jgi:hypothetical protein